MPLGADFEHAVLAVGGPLMVLGLGSARRAVALPGPRAELSSPPGRRPCARVLLGGEPFAGRAGDVVELVGRSHEEIVEAARGLDGRSVRFGVVTGYDGDRLAAPELPTITLKPRPGRRPT